MYNNTNYFRYAIFIKCIKCIDMVNVYVKVSPQTVVSKRKAKSNYYIILYILYIFNGILHGVPLKPGDGVDSRSVRLDVTLSSHYHRGGLWLKKQLA